MENWIVVVNRGFIYEIEEFRNYKDAIVWVKKQSSLDKYYVFHLIGEVHSDE